jgi:hypothetical protein
MTKFLANTVEAFRAISPKTRQRVAWTLAVVAILQIYFVRELLAAELLFGMLFGALFLFVALCYMLGTIWEQGVSWSEVGVRVIASSARRGYAALEDVGSGALEYLSKRQARHPHSESAQ